MCDRQAVYSIYNSKTDISSNPLKLFEMESDILILLTRCRRSEKSGHTMVESDFEPQFSHGQLSLTLKFHVETIFLKHSNPEPLIFSPRIALLKAGILVSSQQGELITP